MRKMRKLQKALRDVQLAADRQVEALGDLQSQLQLVIADFREIQRLLS